MEAMSEDKIFLNQSMGKDLGICEGNKIILHFGSWNREVEIVYSEDIEENTIGISYSLLDQFTVPEDIDFECYSDGNKLYIGPVLGIVRGFNFHNINRGSLNIQLRWVKDYKNIKGLVIIFPLSEVHEGAESVEGYYYNPNNKNSHWAKGTFPFPSAVFNRPVAGVGKKYRLLEKLTEGRFFNSKGSGKWEFFSALSNYTEGKSLVPYTEKFLNFEQLTTMLNKYEILYLKRRFGAKGYGIIQVKKLKHFFEVTRVITGTQKKEKFNTETELQTFLRDLVKKNRYIIQQGVPYETNHKRVDFRAYLQKDGSMVWRVRGFIGRLAKPESVITNLRYTEKILPGIEALKEFYDFDGEKAYMIAAKINEACIVAGKSLDMNLGHFGDVALDFILDDKDNVYFLEANTYYGHHSFRIIRDYELANRIYRSPLEYAKALAGFM